MNICKDAYDLDLKMGDYAITLDDANNEGIISEIFSNNDQTFITIIDENGKILHESIPSSNCTTKERLYEKEYSNTIIWINFHSNKGYIESRIPLNNNSNTDFTIPSSTVGISISFDKYEKLDDDTLDSYSEEIYFFGLTKKVKVTLDEDFNEQIITIKENDKKDWISKDAIVKLYNSNKEFKEELIKTIELLKKQKLDKCNKKIAFKENKDLQETIKKLRK